MNDAMNSCMFLNLGDVFAGTLDAFFCALAVNGLVWYARTRLGY